MAHSGRPATWFAAPSDVGCPRGARTRGGDREDAERASVRPDTDRDSSGLRQTFFERLLAIAIVRFCMEGRECPTGGHGDKSCARVDFCKISGSRIKVALINTGTPTMGSESWSEFSILKSLTRYGTKRDFP